MRVYDRVDRFRVPALVLLLAVWNSTTSWCEAEEPAEAVPIGAHQDTGSAIYVRLCAKCHGDRGTPPPWVESLLMPPPTDLAAETYKYGSSKTAVERSIRLGLGTNMFRFNNRLTERQISAVADYVLRLRSLRLREQRDVGLRKLGLRKQRATTDEEPARIE